MTINYYNKTLFESRSDYEKFMFIGGIPKSRAYPTDIDFSKEPEFVKEHYRKFKAGNEWLTTGSNYLVGGDKMRDMVYVSVAMLRARKEISAYVVTPVELLCLADIALGRNPRNYCSPITKERLSDIATTRCFLGITDYVSSVVKPRFEGEQAMTVKEETIINGYLEMRGEEELPTMIQCAHPIGDLVEVKNHYHIDFLKRNYTQLKQGDIYGS